jgi:hypothetical protein
MAGFVEYSQQSPMAYDDKKSISVRKSTVPERMVAALLLAVVTVVFFGLAVQHLPGSTMLQEVTQFVNGPAQWATMQIFPYGQHSGPGEQYWDYVYWPAGILIYSVFWYFIVSMMWSTRRKVYSR